MADGKDADPFERYFRPRPAGPHGSDDPQSTDALGIPRVEDSAPHGVIVDGARSPHVPVSPRRGHRRQGADADADAGAAGSGGSGRQSRQRRQGRFGRSARTVAAGAAGTAGAAGGSAIAASGDGALEPDGPGPGGSGGSGGSGGAGGSGGSGGQSLAGGGARSIRSARRQRRFLMLTGAMSAFVLLSSGVGWAFQGYVLGRIDKVDPFKGLTGSRPGGGPEGAMNILVAGVDRREGLTTEQIRRLKLGRFEGQRSDTMMMVHVSRNHDKMSVVSLPRDSFVTIPAHRSNGSEGAVGTRIPPRPGKLNWTYTYGGSTLMIDTIEKTTGMRIDHYVEVNFLGFIKMVDALGKVTVCTEQPINDPKSGLRLPAGKSQLDGEQSLAYARARYSLTGGTDLARIDRQQQFMAALIQQALSGSTLTDPVKATRFLNASLQAVRVDKGLANSAPDLVKQMRNLSTDNIAFAKVPLADQDHQVVLGGARQSTVLWDQSAANALFSKINHDEPLVQAPTPPSAAASGQAGGNGRTGTGAGAPQPLTVAPGSITVNVRNGVGRKGLAATAAADLKKAGFRTVVVPGIARTGLPTTRIEYGPGRDDSARTLAAAIPGAKLKRVASLGSRIQVTVGSDWKGAQKVKVVSGGTGSGANAAGGQKADQTLQAKTATQQLCK